MFLFCLIDKILIVLLALDTLGLCQQIRKSKNVDEKDYSRVCFTWIFFFAIRALTCCSCKGFLATVFQLIGLAGKVFVSIPLLGGTNKIYTLLVEQNKGAEYLQKGIDFIKAKISPPAPSAGSSEVLTPPQN